MLTGKELSEALKKIHSELYGSYNPIMEKIDFLVNLINLIILIILIFKMRNFIKNDDKKTNIKKTY